MDVSFKTSGGRRTRFMRKDKKELKTKSNRAIFVSLTTFGIAFGFALIVIGIVSFANSAYAKSSLRSEAQVQADVDAIYATIDVKRSQKTEEYNRNAFSDKYLEMDEELKTLDSTRSDLEAELYNVHSGVYHDMRMESRRQSVPYISAGIFIVVATLLLSSRFYLDHKES